MVPYACEIVGRVLNLQHHLAIGRSIPAPDPRLHSLSSGKARAPSARPLGLPDTTKVCLPFRQHLETGKLTKILYLIDDLSFGGAERQLSLLLKYLPLTWDTRVVSLGNGPYYQVLWIKRPRLLFIRGAVGLISYLFCNYISKYGDTSRILFILGDGCVRRLWHP